MRYVRVFAVFAVVASLAVLLYGLGMVNLYSEPHNRRICLSTETFPLEQKATTYRSVTLNASGTYYLVVYVEDSEGTVFSAQISEDDLEKWLQGQFNVPWDGTLNGGGMFGLSDPCKCYFVEVTGDSVPNVQNIVFRSPESFTLQVNLAVYTERTEVDYVNLNLGMMVAATGGAGILAVTALYAVKNRAQIRRFEFTRRKAAALLIALVMLSVGFFLACTFAGPVHCQKTLNQATINVPANNYTTIPFNFAETGEYCFHFEVEEGTIQAFYNRENSVFKQWENETRDIRLCEDPIFNGSTGELSGIAEVFTGCFIFSNIDGYDKAVTYEFLFLWTYENYFGLMAGVALAALGAIALTLTLLKEKLRDFNRALENQQ